MFPKGNGSKQLGGIHRGHTSVHPSPGSLILYNIIILPNKKDLHYFRKGLL